MSKQKIAQWETGSIDDYVNEFIAKEIPAAAKKIPVSMRDLSDISVQQQDKGSKKNMNRTNPFIDNGGTVKQTGDDQVLLDKPFNDMGGFLPVMAERRRKIRMALWDTTLTVPGMKDTSEGWGSPFSGVGNNDLKSPQKQRDWSDLTSKERAIKLYNRNPKQVVDEINPGMQDLSREVSDGEKI